MKTTDSTFEERAGIAEVRRVSSELRRFIGFGEEDQERLLAFFPHAEPHLSKVVDHFYDRLSDFPRAASVLRDQEHINQLKKTLIVWLVELLTGPWDDAYCQRRVRIGVRHVQVGLAVEYMFGAMSLVREHLYSIAQRVMEDGAGQLCISISRVTDFDLALMTWTYMDASSAQDQRTLQDMILENLPAAVLCLDEEMRVTSSTRLFDSESVTGRPLLEVLPSDLVDAVDIEGSIGIAHTLGHSLSYENVKTSQSRHFKLTIVPVEHALATTLVHVEDTTNLFEAEVRAKQAESLAQIGTLAANVAHEIRNPLAAISATIQIIGRSFHDGDQRRPVLEKLQHQISRLNQLVNDLLGYARPLDAHEEDVLLAECVRDAIITSGVEASMEGEGGMVCADPTALARILVNLLQNASDAGSQVTVRLSGHWIEVEDDGPGVAAEVEETLFEPFVTSKAKGTGLGLAICRKVCAGMGARLDLMPGPPTRFRVTFSVSRTSPAGTSKRSG